MYQMIWRHIIIIPLLSKQSLTLLGNTTLVQVHIKESKYSRDIILNTRTLHRFQITKRSSSGTHATAQRLLSSTIQHDT